MYIVTYKNENEIGWSYAFSKFKNKEDALKWVSKNLPIGTQKCRTGEYEILKVNENGEEI